MGSAVFKLSIPLHTEPASTARKPLYISPNTQSISSSRRMASGMYR